MFNLPNYDAINHHVVMTTRAGGRTGKTTHSLMLTSYLESLGGRGATLVIDFARWSNLFDQLANLFGKTGNEYPQIQSCEFFITPGGKVMVLRPNHDDGKAPDTWPSYVSRCFGLINQITKEKKLRITDVITETNLQFDLDEVRLLHQLDYSRLWIWLSSLRDSISEEDYYKSVEGQAQEWMRTDKKPNWGHIHNPYSEMRGRDGSGIMPSIKSCFDLLHKQEKIDERSSIIYSAEDLWELIGEPASSGYRQTTSSESADDEFWKFAYHRILNEELPLPRNLLPVFKRSDLLQELMARRFTGVEPVTQQGKLHAKIDELADKIFSEVYKPFFRKLQL